MEKEYVDPQMETIEWIKNTPDTRYSCYWDKHGLAFLQRVCRSLRLQVYNRIGTRNECVDALSAFSYRIHVEGE